eukprot:maker-scaffold405_size181423-snap-gene-0.42 protein:Tk08187 transcript:maker-scaffold405_size181423-snap-gene-0.42-mRNA-1 annotation:"unnamed protein product"
MVNIQEKLNDGMTLPVIIMMPFFGSLDTSESFTCAVKLCPPQTKSSAHAGTNGPCHLLWTNGSSDSETFLLRHSKIQRTKFSLVRGNEKSSKLPWGGYEIRFGNQSRRFWAFHESTRPRRITPKLEENQIEVVASEEFADCLRVVPEMRAVLDWDESRGAMPFEFEDAQASEAMDHVPKWIFTTVSAGNKSMDMPLRMELKCQSNLSNRTLTKMAFVLSFQETVHLRSSTHTQGLGFSVALVIAVSVLGALTGLGYFLLKYKKKPSTPIPQLVSLSGPRIKVSHPPLPTRPRLFSILSYFSSSSTSTTSSSTSRTQSESQEPLNDNHHHTLKLMPTLSIPGWAEEHFFDFQSLELGQVLGKGQYGLVYKGDLRDGRARWEVAVKCARPGSGEQDFDRVQEELLKEGEIMATLSYHDHIANLQGLAVEFSRQGSSPKFYLMIQYCGNGSMKSYLEIHQISDFGLSHQLKHRQRSANLRQTHLPERWMAPEAIVQFAVTHECDVWSYGVVLWEIFSYGEKPYKDLRVNSSDEFVMELQNGERLGCPDDCPNMVYDIMTSCWSLDPRERPNFEILTIGWRKMISPSFQFEYEKMMHAQYQQHESIRQNSVYFQMTGATTHRQLTPGGGYRGEAKTRGSYVEADYQPPTTADTVVTMA